MPEAWYLACDMQMYWISPLLIYPLWRWRRAGFAFVLASIIVLILATVAIYVKYPLPATNMFSSRQ